MKKNEPAMPGAEASISLRTKLTLSFATIAIIPLLLGNFITSRIAEQALKQTVFEKNRLLAQNIADDVDLMFTEKLRTLKIAVANADMQSMKPSRQLPILKKIAEQHPDLLILVVTTPQGDLITRSDGKWSRTNYRDRDYFQTMEKTGTTAISDVLQSKTTGKLGIVLAEPIRNSDRTLRGALIMNISLQKVIDRIAKTRIGSTGYAYVVNREGKILIHHDRGLVESAADFSGFPPITAAISRKTGWVEYEFRGQKRLAGYSYVLTTGWGLVAQQPLDEAMADLNAVRKTNIIIMACTVVIALLIVMALVEVLFKPIALLKVAAEKVAEGDLTAQAGFTSTDEIGALAATFNNMTAQLRSRETELKNYQERLEDLVKERTKELELAHSLQERNFRFTEALLSAIPTAVFYKDTEGRYLGCNNTFSEIMGVTSEQIKGKTVYELWPSEHAKIYHEKDLEVMKNPVRQIYEFKVRDKDGVDHPVIYAKDVFRDENNQVAGIVGAFIDITERKQAEEDREKLVHDLRKALAQVKQLSGFIPICGSCKKIRDDKGYWNQIESYLQEHSEAEFSHGLCPDCMKKLYPKYYKEKKE